VFIYIIFFFSACAVTKEYLLCVQNSTKCIVACYAQHVSWPVCISRHLGFPNSWAHCPLHSLYVIWVSQFSLAVESFCFHGLNCVSLLYPPVPCHHTQHHLITVHAFTCAFGSFCGHTTCLTDLLPPILSFFTLHTPLMSSVPLWPHCSSGMGPCMAQHFTAAPIYKHFALHNHGAYAIHWVMCFTIAGAKTFILLTEHV